MPATERLRRAARSGLVLTLLGLGPLLLLLLLGRLLDLFWQWWGRLIADLLSLGRAAPKRVRALQEVRCQFGQGRRYIRRGDYWARRKQRSASARNRSSSVM
jgi:hypothetical protein